MAAERSKLQGSRRKPPGTCSESGRRPLLAYGSAVVTGRLSGCLVELPGHEPPVFLGSKRGLPTAKPKPPTFSSAFCGRRGPMGLPNSTISGPEALLSNRRLRLSDWTYQGRRRILEFLTISMVVLRFPMVCVWEFTGFRVCVPVGGAPSTTTFLHACGPVHDSLNFYGIQLMSISMGFQNPGRSLPPPSPPSSGGRGSW